MCLFTIGRRAASQTYLVEKFNNKWNTVIMMTDDPGNIIMIKVLCSRHFENNYQLAS